MNTGDLIGVAVLFAGAAIVAIVVDKRKEIIRKQKEARHTND